MDKIEIEKMIEKIKISVDSLAPLQGDLTKVASELTSKEKMLQEREQKLKESQDKNIELQGSYMEVQEELNRISSLYTELTGKQDATIDIKQILSVYITLLENVFEGKPHAKILFVLHGEKNQMTRQELNNTLGFSAAGVLHSIHELQRANLIDYDEEAAVVTLKERLY
jgi:chromosome segregation ATPase